MSRGMWLGIILLLIVFVGIALIDAGAKRPIDWRESYLFKDKIPFGTYVFREELPRVMPQDRRFTGFHESYYEFLTEKINAKASESSIVEITEYIALSKEDVRELLSYVEQGGEVFFSSKLYPEILLDTLGVQIAVLDYAQFRPTPRTVHYTLGNDTARVYLDKVKDFMVFTKLNPNNTTILGYLNARGRAIPNYVKITWGKGSIYLHNVPAAFGNYYLLQEKSYNYATKLINVLQHREVQLKDRGGAPDVANTPLRVIIQKPGLAQAWYMLLAGLVLFMLFRSKREQRPVPVIMPEPNKSKEFAQTIGNLYYENGSPSNIIQKKIEYFLFDIRNNFQLDTLDLGDERFIRQLALKAGVESEEVKQLIQLIASYRNKTLSSMEDVRLINQKIEEFKHKANII